MRKLSLLNTSARALRRKWYGLWCLLLWGPAALAQTVTIGSTAVPVASPATSSYLYGPLYRSANDAGSVFNWSRYAHLYTAAELGLPSGAVITELAWLKSNAGEVTGNNTFNVLLENTALTTLGTTQSWGTLSASATSAYASTTQQVTGGPGSYFSVTLTQPFTYSGGNLLILTDWQKQGTASDVVNFVTNPATGFGLGAANSAALTNATNLTSASYGNRRPTLRVTYVPGSPCTAPPTAGTTLASLTSVCAGTGVSFRLQGASYGQGQTYQWQESTNGTTFTDIAGATGPSYVAPSITSTRTFRARLTCSGQSTTSTPVTVTVTPATYAALPVSESFESTWVDACATRDVPNNSWRTVPIMGDASWRRDDDGTSAGWTSPTVGMYTPAGSQGSRSARFHSYYAGAGAIGSLDLYVNLSAAGNKVLQFDYLNTAGNDSLQVQVSTDGGATFGAPLLRLGMSGTVAQGWQPQNVSITSTSATTVIRFRGKVTATFTSDIGLDNVRLDILTGTPNCAINLSPANGAMAVQRPVTLTWQSGGGVATGYDVYFGSSATSLTLVSSNQAAASYAITTSLAGNTTYYYQIVPRNANGTASGCPVQSFTTSNVFAYCNTNLGAYCGTGNANISGVAIANTTLNNPNSTCNTVNGSGYTLWPAAGSTTAALSPGNSYQVSVTTAEAGIISVWFDWNQNGQFEASEWMQVATTSTAGQPATVTVNVPASALPGQTGMRVRSRLSGNPNGAGDACATMGSGETEDYIVTIGPPPACAPPINLSVSNLSTTTAMLNFSGASNGTAVGYIIHYGPTGFTPGGTGSTTINSTSTSVPVTGLMANTTYQFYVTKDCGGGQTSFANGPFSFRTLCLAPVYATLPVIQSFENTWVDGCDTRDIPNSSWRNTPATGNNSWRRDDDGTSAAWTSPASGIYSPVASQGARSARFHTYYAPRGSEGLLDLFVNLSAAGAKRLSFDFINVSGTDSLYVELSDNGGSTFTRLVRLGLSGSATAGFSTQVANISSTSATAVLRFRAKGDFGVTDIGLDNIVLESATGCLTPAQLTATNTTTTTASLSWLTGGAGTYSVEYGPTGFTPGTGTVVTGLTGSPYAVSGLQPGTTYQFYVTQNCTGGNSGTAGPATFTTQIVNDEPCGATVLTVSNSCVPTATTTVGATATPSIPAGTCTGAPTTAPLDVWFRFTTAASGPTSTQVRITVTGAAANTIRAYSASTCNGPFTFLACSAGTSGTSTAPNLDLNTLTPNTTYFVRVGSYGTTTALGNFTICASPVPNCPDPAGPSTGTLTNNTAQLSWSTAPAAGSTFTVIYGPTGFSPATGGTRVTGITGNGTTLTGLTADTGYDFYVQQICGGFNGTSALVGPVSFTTLLTAPANDDPCGALPLGSSAMSASTVGATTSLQAGITLPACSPANSPKDVWFMMTPAGTSSTFTLTGTAVGMLRVYQAPDCANGPFNLVTCQSAGSNNTGFSGPVTLTGLTAGQRYYVALSGFGSSDTPGSFSLTATNLLASRAQAETSALLVYPNPSSTGQLTLRLGSPAGKGQAALVNALGQQVLTTALAAGTPEHTLSTRGLAAGVYTLRVQVGNEVLTRKVVIE